MGLVSRTARSLRSRSALEDLNLEHGLRHVDTEEGDHGEHEREQDHQPDVLRVGGELPIGDTPELNEHDDEADERADGRVAQELVLHGDTLQADDWGCALSAIYYNRIFI